MITFEWIEYQNLLSVGDTPIKVNLNAHPTTLITAPNGSGKSILTEALTFVLFDKSYRGLSKTSLVNSVNQKKCLVKIQFTTRGSTFILQRGIKPNVFTIQKDGKLLEQQASVRDQQKYLETNILGFGYKSFCQTCLLGTANYEPFMQLSAASRREVSETLLDISVFTSMNKILKARISLWKQEYERINSAIERKEHEIKLRKEYSSKIEKGPEEQIKQYQHELLALKDRAQDLSDRRTKAREAKEALLKTGFSDRIEKLTSELDEINTKLTECSHSANISSKEMKFLNDHDVCPTCDQEIDAGIKSSRLQKLTESTNKIQDEQSTLSDKRTELSSSLEKLRRVSAKVGELDMAISSSTTSINAIKESASSITRKIKALKETKQEQQTNDKEQIDLLKGELRALTDEKKRLMSQKPVNDAAALMLKDTGIKASIIDKFVPLLNHKTNEYLDILGFNIQFELDKNFDETIKSRYRNEFSYKNFSQGERQRLDLALLFAWRHVSQVKNSVNCNLLVLDEVFDASIDEQGTNDLIAILRRACKGNNVFVVSHRGTLEERLKNTIRFTKVDGFTRLDT